MSPRLDLGARRFVGPARRLSSSAQLVGERAGVPSSEAVRGHAWILVLEIFWLSTFFSPRNDDDDDDDDDALDNGGDGDGCDDSLNSLAERVLYIASKE